LGSAFEWENQIIIAHGLEYINKEEYNELITNINEIQKMISSFKEKL
jgi:four helix bundle protein